MITGNPKAQKVRKIPERWGFCFAGNELAFCDALELAAGPPGLVRAFREGIVVGRPFVYYEIGIGNGDCLRAACEFLGGLEIPFSIVGVDLPNYSGGAAGFPQWQMADGKLQNPRLGISTVFTGAEEFFARCKTPADFIFIDGCHGAACVWNDFLGAEKLIQPGGIVCFHDTDPLCQGIHLQPHCGTGIEARAAVMGLGLLDNARPGWKKINETTGDKAKGGHGCLFVQRVF